MKRLAFFALVALAGCSGGAKAPTDAQLLAALQTAFDSAQSEPVGEERDADGALVSEFISTSLETAAVEAFAARPASASIIECQPHAAMRGTWQCSAGVTLDGGTKAWGDWLVYHTPSAGWQAAPAPKAAP